jgi:putative hemolysin
MLSTVQIGITLIGIVAGAYGATAIADDLAPMIAAAAPGLAPWLARDIAFGVVIVLTTYLTLVLGELVPKRIAMSAPEPIAGLTAPFMALLARVSGPVVWLLTVSTDGLLRILGLHRLRPSDLTEEEIHALIEEGHSAGLIEPEEREMITGVMRLGDRTVRTIMTPRRDIVWLDPSLPWSENAKAIRESGHSRFPVAVGGADNVIGIVQTKDLVTTAGGGSDVRAAMHAPVFVPESMSVLHLLETMRAGAVRMLLVADEYGTLEGLVTAADVLECIAGDVALSVGEAIEPPKRREDGSWLVDGMTPIDEFAFLMGAPHLAEDAQIETVAGLVLNLMQRLPQVGEAVRHGALSSSLPYRMALATSEASARVGRLLWTMLSSI